MPANPLKAQFDFQTRLFNNVTEGITDSESQNRSAENINNIKWIAGHILHYRLTMMSKLAGVQQDETYGMQFGRGATLDVNAIYPSLEELKSKWNTASPVIAEGISKMSEGILLATAAHQSPIFNIDDTNSGFITFLLSHEATHIGQMGILRKMAGKEAMSFR